MKVSILAAIVPLALSAPAWAVISHDVGAPGPEVPPITVNTCVTFGEVTVDGIPVTPVSPTGPDNVPLYSTGGKEVLAGDILFTDPADSFSVIEMYRIYDDGSGYGNTFSVFTEPGVPPADPFEHTLPSFNTINANIPADQVYTVTYNGGTTGTWSFIACAPEPSTLPLVALATVPLIMPRRRKRLLPVTARAQW